MAAGGWFKVVPEGGRLLVEAGGIWTVATLAALDAPLRALAPMGVNEAAIDLAQVEALDTAGAWVLHRTLKQLGERGISTSFARARPEYATLLKQAAHADRQHLAAEPGGHHFHHLLVRVGKGVYDTRGASAGLLSFFGLLCLTIAKSVLKPGRIRF